MRAAHGGGDRDGVTVDGKDLPADLVVFATGIRPEVALARDAGLEVGRGVLVDDNLRTSAPGVWAVGECAEHRGTVYGLWAPVLEQARAAGAAIAGRPNAFHGAVPATTLKVAGIDLFCAGAAAEHDPLAEEVIALDSRRERYRKLVLREGRLAGATLLGDVADARRLRALIASGEAVPDELLETGGAPSDAPAGPPRVLVPGGLARRDRRRDRRARLTTRRAGLRAHRGGHRLWRLPPRRRGAPRGRRLTRRRRTRGGFLELRDRVEAVVAADEEQVLRAGPRPLVVLHQRRRGRRRTGARAVAAARHQREAPVLHQRALDVGDVARVPHAGRGRPSRPSARWR